MRATLEHIDTHTPDIRTFWFRPEGRFRYTAGEFVELALPHANPDNRGDKRWFSLSSSPTEPLIGITSKFAHPNEQSSSFKQALAALQPGSDVTISDPMGDFLLPKSTDIPIVFVARSIGITPIRSITKWMADTGQQRSIQVLYNLQDSSDQIDAPLFEQYYGGNFHVRTDRVQGSDVLALGGHDPDTLYYFSGPEHMIIGLVAELRATGIANRNIIIDPFPGYPS